MATGRATTTVMRVTTAAEVGAEGGGKFEEDVGGNGSVGGGPSSPPSGASVSTGIGVGVIDMGAATGTATGTTEAVGETEKLGLSEVDGLAVPSVIPVATGMLVDALTGAGEGLSEPVAPVVVLVALPIETTVGTVPFPPLTGTSVGSGSIVAVTLDITSVLLEEAAQPHDSKTSMVAPTHSDGETLPGVTAYSCRFLQGKFVPFIKTVSVGSTDNSGSPQT